jgi:FkbM family methyltransferase
MQMEALAKLGRLYPFLSGNFSLVNSARIKRWVNTPNELAWCPSPGGPILVSLSDDVGRCIFLTGDYDRKITWICRQLLRPGDTALDIGANLGVVTLAMAKFVGPTGHVHSFEPNPAMQDLAAQSIARSYKNVTLHRLALGSEDAELELRVPPSNIGAGSFVNHKQNAQTKVVRCPVRKLSDITASEGIKNIRLIKIDVEGFENEVLTGASDVLSQMRPDAIILETNQVSDIAFRDLPPIATLLRHQYRLLAIPKALFSMKTREFEISQPRAPSHDVVAIPAEKYETVRSLL